MPSKSDASRPSSRTKALALAALAGGVLPLAFAPFHLWWLAPVSYAALFALWRRATPREAFQRGFVFGAAEFLLGVYWIYISVHEIGEAPIWIALLLMLGLVAVMAVYPALTGWIAARWLGTDRSWHWLGSLPALFVLMEWLRGWFLTGFGWLSPGYSQTESWLAGYAPVFGVLGVGWGVLLLAGVLLTLVSGSIRGRVAAAATALLLLGFGFIAERTAWTSARDREITVALAQANIVQTLKWDPAELPGILRQYRELTLEALGSDLIVWPEVAIPDYFEAQTRYFDEIESLTEAAGSRILASAWHYHEAGAQNAVFALGSDNGIYVKRHLVPYGEYFPVPDFVRSWMRALGLPTIDTEPGGAGQSPIDLLGEHIAVTICYEDVFGAEQLHSFPEATLLVNVSNDAWFGESIALPQHLQIARMRAAEVRRWQLRATNTGFTVVIDPFGRVTDELTAFEPGVLKATVRGMDGTTPYILWGNWMVVLLAATVVGAGLAMRRGVSDGDA